MRYVISLIFLIFSLQSYANPVTIWVMDNNAGGSIILSNDKCNLNPKHRQAIATLDTGERIFGCWAKFNGKVNAMFFYDGIWKSRKYNPQDFIPVEVDL